MSEAVRKERREFRNIHVTQILRYRMPLAAIVSILHRISGVLIFLLLPFLLYLFDLSLTSETSFDTFRDVLSHGLVKLVLLALIWAYLHHFCAGIRHLLLDVHIAGSKEGGRKTAATTLVISLLLTLVIGLKLFGAF